MKLYTVITEKDVREVYIKAGIQIEEIRPRTWDLFINKKDAEKLIQSFDGAYGEAEIVNVWVSNEKIIESLGNDPLEFYKTGVTND